MDENALSRVIVDSAIMVHRTLGGPGLLESIYEEALVWELQQRSLHVDRQCQVPIAYRGQQLSSPLRLDILVEKLVIIEVKSTIEYNPIFEAQTLTYLRLTNLKLGMIINFGERYVRNGIHRVVNRL